MLEEIEAGGMINDDASSLKLAKILGYWSKNLDSGVV